MKIHTYFEEIVNNLYLLQNKDLELLKRKITPKDIDQLQVLLNEGIALGIHSVTEKKHCAPSKNPHDYMSCSIYHWPNPNTPDGLPYIERDGVDNPEAIHGDKESLRTLAYITFLSGLLYYFTLEDHYLQILLKYNRFWFMDETTRMNPNLRYAQCIPGVNDGEPGGIIDYAASYGYALNILRILHQQQLLPEDFYQQMKEWHKEFLNWLLTSEQGQIEGKRVNNQGSLYDLLILNISSFLGEEEKIGKEYHEKLLKRCKEQINEKGLLPYELVRTKSKSYMTMGLKMLLESAYLLQECGFHYEETEELKRAYQYVLPHYLNQTWEFQQIKEFDVFRGYYILYLFQRVIGVKPEVFVKDVPMHWGSILLKILFKGE